MRRERPLVFAHEDASAPIGADECFATIGADECFATIARAAILGLETVGALAPLVKRNLTAATRSDTLSTTSRTTAPWASGGMDRAEPAI